MLASLRDHTRPRTCCLMELGNVCFPMYALVWKAEIWKILTFASTFKQIKKEA